MDNLQVSTQDPQEKIVKIPTALYQSWLKLIYQFIKTDGMSPEDAQKKVYGMLRNWILAYHPTCKLCAFEEVLERDKKRYVRPELETGMYVKLREMSPEDLKLSMQMNKEGKLGKEGNPQWILETSYIAEFHKLMAGPEHFTEEQPLLSKMR